jgi:hypothetical protein
MKNKKQQKTIASQIQKQAPKGTLPYYEINLKEMVILAWVSKRGSHFSVTHTQIR